MTHTENIFAVPDVDATTAHHIDLTAQGDEAARERLIAAVMAAAAEGDDVLIGHYLAALADVARANVVGDIASDLDAEGHAAAADYVNENYA